MTARRYSSQDQAQPASRVERLDARAALSPPCSPPLVQPLHELHLRGIQPAADIGGKVRLHPCAPFVSQGAASQTSKRPSTPPGNHPQFPIAPIYLVRGRAGHRQDMTREAELTMTR